MRRFNLFPFTLALAALLSVCILGRVATETPSVLSDSDIALQTLVECFHDLHEGRYGEAAERYGGTYEIMIEHNPSVNPNDHAALFRNACTINGAQCLEIRTAALEAQVSPTEFRFTVQFQNDDGSLFVLSPCCGAEESDQPPRSAFSYTVKRTPQGIFVVMDMPVYLP